MISELYSTMTAEAMQRYECVTPTPHTRYINDSCEVKLDRCSSDV